VEVNHGREVMEQWYAGAGGGGVGVGSGVGVEGGGEAKVKAKWERVSAKVWVSAPAFSLRHKSAGQ
jgi:hypothetical protein